MSNIHQSAEDYLEKILLLKKRQGKVRSIDIVEVMNFSKPSVSIAMKKLKEKGLITIDDGGYIDLTDSGHEIAARIYERHIVISQFLQNIGVSFITASQDACKLEHELSEESFQLLKKLVEKQQKDHE